MFWGLGITHLDFHHFCHSDRKDQVIVDLNSPFRRKTFRAQLTCHLSTWEARQEMVPTRGEGTWLLTCWDPHLPSPPLNVCLSSSRREKTQKEYVYSKRIHSPIYPCECTCMYMHMCTCVHITFVSPAWILYHWVTREAHFTLMDNFSWVCQVSPNFIFSLEDNCIFSRIMLLFHY